MFSSIHMYAKWACMQNVYRILIIYEICALKSKPKHANHEIWRSIIIMTCIADKFRKNSAIKYKTCSVAKRRITGTDRRSTMVTAWYLLGAITWAAIWHTPQQPWHTKNRRKLRKSCIVCTLFSYIVFNDISVLI